MQESHACILHRILTEGNLDAMAYNENAYDSDSFVDLVNRDIRDEAKPEDAAKLREPSNVERWFTTLTGLKTRVEAQITANRAELAVTQAACYQQGPEAKAKWLQAKADSDLWRSRAVSFKAGVERRLSEARSLRSEQRTVRYADVLRGERDRARELVYELRSVISRHRSVLSNPDSDEDAIERAEDELWSYLDLEPEL